MGEGDRTATNIWKNPGQRKMEAEYSTLVGLGKWERYRSSK